MVKRFLLLIPWLLLAENPSTIEIVIDSQPIQANYPIQAQALITHDREVRIASDPLTWKERPLEAALIKHVTVGEQERRIISIYEFLLPPQPQGEFHLAEIKAHVGNQWIEAPPMQFMVEGAAETVADPDRLLLETHLVVPHTLYAGQRFFVQYLITFRGAISLSKSDLPLLNAPFFQKVGDVVIQEQEHDSTHTQQILTQEYEARLPGTFSFPESLIEGRSNTKNLSGDIHFEPFLLRATAPPVHITVLPLPSEKKPLSFTGGIGSLQATARLLSPNTIQLGEMFEVEIAVSGISNIETFTLPDLPCEPGFPGVFQFSPLPPITRLQGNSKIFQITLRPLSEWVDQIFPFELSSFDPESQRYIVQRTEPLPVHVLHASATPPLNNEEAPPPALLMPTCFASPPSSHAAVAQGPDEIRHLLKFLAGAVLLLALQWRFSEPMRRWFLCAIEELAFRRALKQRRWSCILHALLARLHIRRPEELDRSEATTRQLLLDLQERAYGKKTDDSSQTLERSLSLWVRTHREPVHISLKR